MLLEKAHPLPCTIEADTEAQWRAVLVHAERPRLEYSQRLAVAGRAALKLERKEQFEMDVSSDQKPDPADNERKRAEIHTVGSAPPLHLWFLRQPRYARSQVY